MSASNNLGKQWRQPALPGIPAAKKQDTLYSRRHKSYKLDYSNEVNRPNTSRPLMTHKITASLRGKPVGHIEWDEHVPEVADIQVHPKHQRKGIATAMYMMAASLPTKHEIEHSMDRTQAGEAWSKTTPNYYPSRGAVHAFNNYEKKK